MGEDKREGFVVEWGSQFLRNYSEEGNSWDSAAARALVFPDAGKAKAVSDFVGRGEVRPLADVLRSLGCVASEMASVLGFPIWATDGGRADDWELIAQAVVEEHERRKR